MTHNIKVLVDVRSFPVRDDTHNSIRRVWLRHFLNRNHYAHLPSLGGRRKPNVDSKNTAWKNASFRAYADYMELKSSKKELRSYLNLRVRLAGNHVCRSCLWRCHRSLISDYLKAQGLLSLILSIRRTHSLILIRPRHTLLMVACPTKVY